ncbi:hypothetical protein DENSPDRAFT_847639 [Dentipellis sp. KUC8613]|nr:hypothetical protein DENSPDRAFT_847639 [Dentipellis sp. KUC8613]
MENTNQYPNSFSSVEGLQNSPITIAAQTELIQPALLSDLSPDALTQMVDSKRESLHTRRAELQMMQAQITEKRRQIELLYSLVETQIHYIRLSQIQLEEVELYAQAQNINIEDRLAQKYKLQREQEKMIIAAEAREIWTDEDSVEDMAMTGDGEDRRR